MSFRHITKTVYKVHDFILWQRSKSLVLSPSFQRRPVWSPSAKSYLIDTIIKGLPVPIIFIRETTNLKSLEPTREVIDGQQRLRTLISYIDSTILPDYKEDIDSFKIKKNHNKQLANKTYNELDEVFKQRILNYEFSVHTLPSETEDSEVLQIFARMNSTGVKLNGQELRNAEFFGEFKTVMYDLAYQNLSRWRDWNVFNENEIARMQEVEEVSDLVNIIMHGVNAKSQAKLNELYRRYDEVFYYEGTVIKRFNNVMNKIDEMFGRQMQDTAFKRRGLFNALFTFIYDIMYGLNSKLDHQSARSIDSSVYTGLLIASEQLKTGERLSDELRKSLRGATADAASRRQRLSFLKRVCDGQA